MNELERFIQKIQNITQGSEVLSIDKQRHIVYEINKFLFCTHDDIGTTMELDEEKFQFFSDYHKYWKNNYGDILSLSINEEQCEKVADVLHDLYVMTKGKVYEEIFDTFGLNRNQVFLIRILTANQDFNGSRDFKEQVDIYLENADVFNPDRIIEAPSEFIGKLKLSALSQTDKRETFAKNIALFLNKYGCDPDTMLGSFNNNVYDFRTALIDSNSGYGNKKTDMFIRDMVQTRVWVNVSGFDKIDVASDVNTIKIAMRTGMLKSGIPLISSFMDIFCYQYSHVDFYNAKAWRRVWEIWGKKYPSECVKSPCQMDYLIYNLFGRKICKENLTKYTCKICNNSFCHYNARKSVCPKCHNKELSKTSSLPCINEKGKCVITHLASDKEYAFLNKYSNCPLSEICNNGGSVSCDPPKSISIKGRTGWTSAYSDEENGGGGLMS